MVHDINADGVDDIFLLNTNGDPQTRGVYIILGGSDASDHYHGYVDTSLMSPLSLTVRDFSDDGVDDVMLFGTEEADGRSFVALYAGLESGVEFAAPLIRELALPGGLLPHAADPVFVDSGQFDASGELHVLLGAPNFVYTGKIPLLQQREFGSMALTEVRAPNGGTAANGAWQGGVVGARAVANPDGGPDRVLVSTQQSARLTAGDEGGDFSEGQVFLTGVPSNGHRHSTFHDIDGDGVVDITGGQGVFLSAVSPWPESMSYTGESLLPDSIVGVSVDDLDSDNEVDIVMLIGEDPYRLYVLQNVYFDAGQLKAASQQSYDFEDGFVPVTVAIGDFDGDERREVICGDAPLGGSVCSSG